MVIKAANRDMVVSGVSTVGEKLYFLGGGLKRQSYTVTDATFASPILITTSSAHGLVDGDQVYIQGVAGNNAANGSWIITKNDDTSFTLNGSTGDGSYLLGGTIDLMQIDTYEFDGGDSETKAWYLAWNYTDNGDDETAKKVKGLSCTGKFTNTEVEVHGIRQTGAVDLTTLESGHGLDSLTWNVPDTSSVERVRRVYRDWGPYSLWTVRISGSNTDGGDRFDELVVAYDMEQSTKT